MIVYTALFRGQLAWLGSSYSIDLLAENIRMAGIDADVFDYQDEDEAIAAINMWKKRGAKIAEVGYSLGVTTATYIQTFIKVDLLVSIAASQFGLNHKVDLAKNSILYRGSMRDPLSSAGGKDGYKTIIDVSSFFGIPLISHIGLPYNSIVQNGVLNALGKLKGS